VRVRCGRGFTLVELLAVIAVLAVLSMLGFRGLASVLESEKRLDAETQRWKDATALFAQFGHDLSLAVERPVRDAADRPRAALLLRGAESPDAMDARLEISRLGEREGGASQGDLRRVGYRLRGNTLEYLVWPAIDAAPASAPAVHAAMEDVVELRLRALGHDGAWRAAWSGDGPARALPRAIELQLALSGGVRITRLFALR
jgi:general secretion pathway protein J